MNELLHSVLTTDELANSYLASMQDIRAEYENPQDEESLLMLELIDEIINNLKA